MNTKTGSLNRDRPFGGVGMDIIVGANRGGLTNKVNEEVYDSNEYPPINQRNFQH